MDLISKQMESVSAVCVCASPFLDLVFESRSHSHNLKGSRELSPRCPAASSCCITGARN